jgi:hypothetical protein
MVHSSIVPVMKGLFTTHLLYFHIFGLLLGLSLLMATNTTQSNTLLICVIMNLVLLCVCMYILIVNCWKCIITEYNYQRQYTPPSVVLFVNVTHHNREFFEWMRFCCILTIRATAGINYHIVFHSKAQNSQDSSSVLTEQLYSVCKVYGNTRVVSNCSC